MEINQKILSDITVFLKYAKYTPELNRRELWDELVTRNKEMHLKKYPEPMQTKSKQHISLYMTRRFYLQ